MSRRAASRLIISAAVVGFLDGVPTLDGVEMVDRVVRVDVVDSLGGLA